MRILILGGDGYLGWPTAMAMAACGHQVMIADNFLRRMLCLETDSEPLFFLPSLAERVTVFKEITGHEIIIRIGNCAEMDFMERLFIDFSPDAVVHYAEQPSAPYSMVGPRQARLTLDNNLQATMNLIWAVSRHAPDCHIIKLGTMGEYGTPDIDIEEGWIDIEHKGRKDLFLFPRQAGSLYHTTKIMDTDLLWFYVRSHGIRVTDLMQGPVYGLSTNETEQDDRLLPHFNYDDIFGTVVNRFLVQAAAGIPLTVYGRGGQTRGYLNLKDTIQCVELALGTPSSKGEFRIFNQFTEQFTVLQLADTIRRAGKLLGIDVAVKSIANPRKEAEEHYYNAAHSGLLELGLTPHYMTPEVLADMLQHILRNKDRIVSRMIQPRVKWA